METKVKFVAPLLVVADMQRARTFYETVLWLKVIVDFGENITFEGNFSLHLQSHFQSLIDGKTIKTGGNDFEIYFEYDAIDELACFNFDLDNSSFRIFSFNSPISALADSSSLS